jgi:hypothetical protein
MAGQSAMQRTGRVFSPCFSERCADPQSCRSRSTRSDQTRGVAGRNACSWPLRMCQQPRSRPRSSPTQQESENTLSRTDTHVGSAGGTTTGLSPWSARPSRRFVANDRIGCRASVRTSGGAMEPCGKVQPPWDEFTSDRAASEPAEPSAGIHRSRRKPGGYVSAPWITLANTLVKSSCGICLKSSPEDAGTPREDHLGSILSTHPP